MSIDIHFFGLTISLDTLDFEVECQMKFSNIHIDSYALKNILFGYGMQKL